MHVVCPCGPKWPIDINSEPPGYGSVAAGNAVLGRLHAMLEPDS